MLNIKINDSKAPFLLYFSTKCTANSVIIAAGEKLWNSPSGEQNGSEGAKILKFMRATSKEKWVENLTLHQNGEINVFWIILKPKAGRFSCKEGFRISMEVKEAPGTFFRLDLLLTTSVLAALKLCVRNSQQKVPAGSPGQKSAPCLPPWPYWAWWTV